MAAEYGLDEVRQGAADKVGGVLLEAIVLPQFVATGSLTISLSSPHLTTPPLIVLFMFVQTAGSTL